MEPCSTFTAFAGDTCVGTGSIETLLPIVKELVTREPLTGVLIFEDRSGKQIDFDLHGTVPEVLAKLASHPLFAMTSDKTVPAGPGRPKLGVVCREISLLPRHWEWLESHSSGISATLRKLIDEARKREPEAELQRRLSQTATHRVMMVLAGDLPGFEEASRSLFANQREQFVTQIASWHPDIRNYLIRLLGD